MTEKKVVTTLKANNFHLKNSEPKNEGKWKFGIGYSILFQAKKWGIGNLSPHL